jgi:hypothetical protein
MKQIFTKTQAVSTLAQIKSKSDDIDMMKPVDPKHNLFKHSCEDLEKMLSQYVSEEKFAGVVEDYTPPSTPTTRKP